ncbi:unnamed protein product [Closterium sp. Naga37s-1]|nr:unnamed protein product [Closterium sp. Naga37s-1]
MEEARGQRPPFVRSVPSKAHHYECHPPHLTIYSQHAPLHFCFLPLDLLRPFLLVCFALQKLNDEAKAAGHLSSDPPPLKLIIMSATLRISDFTLITRLPFFHASPASFCPTCSLHHPQKLHEEAKAAGRPSSAPPPLKLIIMSATLRISDFTLNTRLFPAGPPPVVSVPARQFPVTVHFARRTELMDYVRAAEKKVSAIHRKLPPGGVLVFLTGQREVEDLCRKLRKKFPMKVGRQRRGEGGGRGRGGRGSSRDAGRGGGGRGTGGRDGVEVGAGGGGSKKKDAEGKTIKGGKGEGEGREGGESGEGEKGGEADGMGVEKQGEPDANLDAIVRLESVGRARRDGSGRQGGERDGAAEREGEEAVGGVRDGEEEEAEWEAVVEGGEYEGEEGGDDYEEDDEEDEEEEWETWGLLGGEKGEGGETQQEGAVGEAGARKVAGTGEVAGGGTEPGKGEEAGPGGKGEQAGPGGKGEQAGLGGKGEEAGLGSKEEQAGSGGMYVLPLYAMLPAAQQLKVFGVVPEGCRLVVVATNVAETSITIPGIRYVVDTGRAKVKQHTGGVGLARFTVEWISRASADQRAGRAGRTGPGQCYRLFSSAVFANQFEAFGQAEIERTPIEGVVLQMKAMGIDKVLNFPFPTPPEPHSLASALHCLQHLSALPPPTFPSPSSSSSASHYPTITPLGRAMACLPISPRHARTLLAILHEAARKGEAGVEEKGEREQGEKVEEGEGEVGRVSALVVRYAIAVVAAMSVESPFLRDDDSSTADQGDGEGKGERGDGEDGRRGEESESRAAAAPPHGGALSRRAAHALFWSRSSDAITAANALRAYDAAVRAGKGGQESRSRRGKGGAGAGGWGGAGERFCQRFFLRERCMREMSQLAHQLSRLLLTGTRAHLLQSFLSHTLSSSSPSALSSSSPASSSAPSHPAAPLPLTLLVERGEQLWAGREGDREGRVEPQLREWEEGLIRRGLAAGWPDRLARKMAPGDKPSAAGAAGGAHSLPKRAVRYEALFMDDPVLLHPRSATFRSAPPLLLFNEIVQTESHPFLVTTTAVDPSWLPSSCPALCSLSKPLPDPPPRYHPPSDRILATVAAVYGPKRWPLPACTVDLEGSRERAAVFACALLQGQVVGAMKRLHGLLAGNPTSLLRPEGLGQRRAADLVHRLMVGVTGGGGKGAGGRGESGGSGGEGVRGPVDSKGKLRAAWECDGEFLRAEVRTWVRAGQEGVVDGLWRDIVREVVVGAKKKQKR